MDVVQKQSWIEMIYLTVTSDGTTGPQWVHRLTDQGWLLSGYSKGILNSLDFSPTSGVKYRVGILRGTLFPKLERFAQKVRDEAGRHNLLTLPVEVACLIREYCSNEEIEAMGLCGIIAMHEPVTDTLGFSRLLCASCHHDGVGLDGYNVRPETYFLRNYGFGFLISESTLDD